MLMRSEGNDAVVDCDDPVIALACNLDSEDCPAACKNSKDEDSDEEDTKVRSGDLAVTADSAANRKILKTGTSDLDTITFKTSEEVEITKITLERYGYSDSDQITEVRLEDQDGNIIADGKGLTKDKVTLNIKKDYRKVDGEFEATVVVTTKNAGGTIGFKVTDVESTAKNLNLDDYNPYTYEVVEYVGSTVTVELKGSNKTYNYEDGESYEIARLKVSAGDNAVLVKGFTLTNSGKVDMKESLDKLTVKADSEEVKAKASVNKDDELVVTFNEDVEIGINKKVTFILSASFKDFDDYGEVVEYYVAEEGDFNAVEKKNGTRVQLDLTKANKTANHTVYTFNGGKIKLTNKKLGNVDAAQASEGTIVAEWDITITEPISKWSFVVTGSSQWAENLTLVINGDEFEGKRTVVGATWTWDATSGTCNIAWITTEAKCKAAYTDAAQAVFTFNNVNIDESGKIQFKVDILDNERAANKTLQFSPSINGDLIAGAKYDNVSKQYVKAGDVAGSISFSKVTIQAAKAALENKLSKDVEFLTNETNRKVVFDGTYTARKSDLDLNKFTILSGSAPLQGKNKVTFYLFIDGEEVWDTNTIGSEESFSDVRIKAGESIKVKVEAEVEAYDSTIPTNAAVYTLELKGTDTNGNEDTGKASDDLMGIKIKGKGGITVEKSATKNTLRLKRANADLATFNISPSNGDDDVLVEDLIILVKDVDNDTVLSGDSVRVKVDGVEQYDWSRTWNNHEDLLYDVSETINGKVEVSIALKKDLPGNYRVTVKKINENTTERIYNKKFVSAVVTLTEQKDLDGTTKFSYDITEKSDSDYTVSDFCLYAATGDVSISSHVTDTTKALWCKAGDIESDNLYFEVKWATSGVTFVKAASYVINKGNNEYEDVVVDYNYYSDYFSINGSDARVYKVKN